jgi:hypothetical protein
MKKRRRTGMKTTKGRRTKKQTVRRVRIAKVEGIVFAYINDRE